MNKKATLATGFNDNMWIGYFLNNHEKIDYVSVNSSCINVAK